METYKQEFIEFMVRAGALTFGDFVTKSGRRTPYFINTGRFDTGSKLVQLGEYYASAIMDRFGGACDCLFGPAYKGIPLAVATAAALWRNHHREVAIAFNRKEAKDHGEGGAIIGHQPQAGERVLLIDDVATSGASLREAMGILAAQIPHHVELVGALVSVDRMEKGQDDRSALEQLRQELGLKIVAIVTIEELVAHLYHRRLDGKTIIDDTLKARIDSYRHEYGAHGGG